MDDKHLPGKGNHKNVTNINGCGIRGSFKNEYLHVFLSFRRVTSQCPETRKFSQRNTCEMYHGKLL